MKPHIFLLPLWAALVSGATADPPAPRLLGVVTIPTDAAPDGLPVGGVSGVDYDSSTGSWFLVSDDKSEYGPARFWIARIALSPNGPPSVDLLQTIPMRRPDGATFPPAGTGAEASDSESIRKVPGKSQVIWSTEGDDRDGFGPALTLADMSGRFLGRITLPPMFDRDPVRRTGPRPNLSIEGVSFLGGGRDLWFSLEAPLFQDGPVASPEHGVLIRLTHLAFPSGRMIAQYAYPVEPIGPVPPGRLADNGVSEILMLDDRHVLVIERSGVQQPNGDFAFRPRLYCASLNGADDISGMTSLMGRAPRTARKRLVYDFTTVGQPRIDNVEGMTLGPRLPDGKRSLVFVTDNDFSPRRASQVIALELPTKGDNAAVARTLCPR